MNWILRGRSALPRDARDRGEIVVNWLAKVSIVLVVAGIILFDGISTAVLRMQLQDAAMGAALEAVSERPNERPTRQAAYDRAAGKLAQSHPDFTLDPASVIVGRDGSVTVTVSGEARTLVAGKITQFDRWTAASATGTGRPAH